MSLDGRLLSLAKDRLDARRHARELERDRREREVYAKNPRVRELDSAIRTAMAKTFAAALDHADGLESRIEAVREECQNLEAERSEEIISAGFPYDYLDMGYICDDCQDTGFIGSKPCACLLELYAEEQRRALSDLFKLGSESFDSFDLSWYDENPDPVTGVSPREHMEAVKEMCYRYADGFGKRSMNLLLTGAPGLGKTFLSACIARTVSEHGFSVVYETAQTVFQRFEDQRFSRGDPEAVGADIKRYLSCDLLILDDLGTELTSSFTQSALYELINTRLTSGRKTVINTNLSVADIRSRYTPQIASRLEGEYQVLPFFGSDIRQLRRTRR
jgi:DNA replication protein DnaC